jgi:hypothetical protein
MCPAVPVRIYMLALLPLSGDHFSLLRQDLPDMEPLVVQLKLKLGAWGWAEAVRRDARGAQWAGDGAAAAMAELDDYLARMGVR